MLEIDLNIQLADLLKHHGINVEIGDGFVHTDLLVDSVKCMAKAFYYEVNKAINSRLDITILTKNGERILESFGDYGETLEEAVYRNFQNFSISSLHPLLAAFGYKAIHISNQIVTEEWEINGKIWEAYIGNLVPKVLTDKQEKLLPPSEFFDSFEHGIKSQKLTNRLHWFRGYYCQVENEITVKEFLIDNESIAETDKIFNNLPILPNVTFYSCRNFIVLKQPSFH